MIQAQSGIRLTLAEAQAVAAERAYAVRYAGFDKDQAASTTRETIASGFPQIGGTVEYNRYIDIPTQVSSGDMFGFPDYLTTFLGGVAQATGVPLDAPPTDPDAIQEFQFGAEQTMTAGITATQLVFSPSYFVGIQAAKAYASAMEAAESSSIADARRAAGEAYAAALAADQNVAILREAEALATDAFKQTRALVEAGLAEATDADQLELAVSDVAQQRATAESMAQVALDALKFTIGMPVETTVILADSFARPSKAPSTGRPSSAPPSTPFAFPRSGPRPRTSSYPNSASATKRPPACRASARSIPTSATPSATPSTSSAKAAGIPSSSWASR